MNTDGTAHKFNTEINKQLTETLAEVKLNVTPNSHIPYDGSGGVVTFVGVSAREKLRRWARIHDMLLSELKRDATVLAQAKKDCNVCD